MYLISMLRCRCSRIGDTAACALKMVELVQMGKLEKGDFLSAGHLAVMRAGCRAVS